MWIADKWEDYELLDCGGGEKLERWGRQILVRPDPQAIWETPHANRGWKDVYKRQEQRRPKRFASASVSCILQQGVKITNLNIFQMTVSQPLPRNRDFWDSKRVKLDYSTETSCDNRLLETT